MNRRKKRANRGKILLDPWTSFLISCKRDCETYDVFVENLFNDIDPDAKTYFVKSINHETNEIQLRHGQD